MSRIIRLMVWLPLIGWLAAPALSREEVWEDEMQYEARTRVNLLIKGLDSTHMIRDKFTRELVDLSRGKLGPLTMRQLRMSVTDSNSQIVEGIVEVFTRVNDPTVIPLLEDELLYNPALDVRLSIILHLPLFCVRAGKERDDLLNFLEEGQGVLPADLAAALRRQPFDPQTGQYDLLLDEDVRARVENALAWQLDPVEAVIESGLEQRNQGRALELLKEMLGVDLGHTRNAWLDFWRSRGRTFKSPLQDDIQETQIAACLMLGRMGAEGRSALIDRIRWVMTTPYNTVRQAALQMLAQNTGFSVAQQPELARRLLDPKLKQPEELWIRRRQESAARLRALVLELAQQYLSDPAADIRLALVDCLGATATPEAVPLVARAFRTDGQSPDMRIHAARALGDISGLEAELLLEQMAAFRGITVDREQQVDEYQRVRAASYALGRIIGGLQNGKLVFRDAASSARAADFLIAQLADTRRFSGAPLHGDPEEQTVRFLARQILREILENPGETYDPAYWKDAYRGALQGH